MRRLVLLIFITALGALPVSWPGGPAEATSIDVEAVIWQFSRDYPGADGNDLNLPIKTVYIKTHDGTDWMSRYDSSPRAVSGPDSLRSIVQEYAYQNIAVVAWFVPYGQDIEGQLQRAREVIDAGVKGLVADVEPYNGFCAQDCAMLAENFWKPLRAQRPNANLGVTYDPRTQWLGPAAIPTWLSVADMAAPECYWETFAGQGVWGDPGGCVMQAHADVRAMTTGRNLEYAPMLQGDASPSGVRYALDTAISVGATRASLWRRGVVSADVWNEIRAFVGEPTRPCWVTRSDNCLIRENSDPRIWLIQSGAKFHVASWEALYSLGFTPDQVHFVPDGFAKQFPQLPREGSLLKEAGLDPIYIVYAGARFWVPNPDTFNALGLDWSAVRLIPAGSIGQISTRPVNYSRFIEQSEPEQYVFIKGKKLHITPAQLELLLAAGAGQTLYRLWPGALDAYPDVTLRLGDASCDESVDAVDALRLLQATAGIPNLGLCTGDVGDVDCDSDSDSLDALKLLRWVAGLYGSSGSSGDTQSTTGDQAICANIGSVVSPS